MPKVLPIQHSFSYGELSPLSYSRSDLEVYREAVAYSENFAPLIQGPMSKRSGTRHRGVVPYSNGRIFSFYVAPFLSFIVIVTEETIYVFDQSGRAITPDYIQNGSFVDGGDDWTVDAEKGADVIFGSGACALEPGKNDLASIRQHIAAVDPLDEHDLAIDVGEGEGELTVWVGSSERGSEYFSGTFTGTTNIEIHIPDTMSSCWIEVFAPADEPIKVLNLVSFKGIPVNHNFENPGFAEGSTGWTDISTGAGYITFELGECSLFPGADGPEISGIRQFNDRLDPAVEYIVLIQPVVDVARAPDSQLHVRIGSTAGGVDIFSGTYVGDNLINIPLLAGLSELWFDIYIDGYSSATSLDSIILITGSDPSLVEFDSPWVTATDIEWIQTALSPDDNAMYMVALEVAPHKLTYSRTEDSWTFIPVPFIDPPSGWTAGNYPGAICFEQGRLWFGGTILQPNYFWGSKSGEYETFTPPGETPVADDAVYFNIKQRCTIQWMIGHTDLIIGTDVAEYRVTGSDGIIIPGDIQIDEESSFGSARVQPIKVGTKIVFVNSDRKKLYQFYYDWTKSGYVATDLTFFADHLFANTKIRSMSYAKNPNSSIVLTTYNSDVFNCLIHPTTSKIGWYRVGTQGEIVDAEIINYGGTSQFWSLTNRGAVDYDMHLEQVDPLCRLDDNSHLILDTPSTNISVPHLANKTCGVIADRAIHPDIVIDGAGEGILNYPASDIYVGLGYTAKMITLPIDVGQQGASGMPSVKRWNKILVRIIGSALPKINGDRPPTRHPATPMDSMEPMITEDIQVISLGYDRFAQITIEQDLPLPTIISGIFGEMTQDTVG